MTHDSNETKEEKKRSYVKPQITQVELRPEEAVLGACKTTTAVGALQAFCTVPGQCYIIAS